MAFSSTQNLATYGNNLDILSDKTPSLKTYIDELQGGAFAPDAVTGTTQQAVSNGSYIPNNAGLVTITLPSVSAVGARLRVVGLGAGGWKIAQTAGQVINKSATPTTTGVGGSLASGNRYNAVELVCVIANTTWNVASSEGTLTIV